MKDWLYHNLVGNDTPPWAVAAARGLFGAFVVGGLAGFNAWAETDDIAFIIRTTGIAVFGWLAVRAGIEGILDTWKNGR
jgi:hypothetical protein